MILLLGLAGLLRAEPFADIHTHYKWSQTDVTRPVDVIQTLDQNRVDFAVVIGTPAELALQVKTLAPDRIIAIWSPYRVGGDWSRWAFDPGTVERARHALAGGEYQGIGELHLVSGFAPRPDSPVLSALSALAAEYDVPMMLHTEFSNAEYLLALCRTHPDTRYLWAHAGAILTPAQVEDVITQCPNVWVELSARDPWRYVDNPITDEKHTLLPAWRALLERWPARFMVGSDPVWPVEQLDAWDQDDTGWQEYSRFIAFHRDWLGKLDRDLAARIRYENAVRLFAITR